MSSLDRANPLFLKFMVIALLTLVLLIPLRQVESLIAQRSRLRDSAVERVALGVGHAQYVGFMMLKVPVTRRWTAGAKNYCTTTVYRVLADSVEVQGSIDTQIRRSGIYDVPTFQARLHAAGSISSDTAMKQWAPEPGVETKVGRASLFMAISDPAGIRDLEGIRIGGKLVPVSAATEAGISGVAAEIGDFDPTAPQHLEFGVDLALAGTERLQLFPWAQATHANLSSSWPSPSFTGAFSPDLAPQVRPGGFAAQWRVLQINRNYAQVWSDDAVTGAQIYQSAFGVDFYQPVDTYQRDYRAVHYALLFITLTFMALFLWEHTLGKPVHALQYAMIGMALAVFYLVLVALSEHATFAQSYTLAAGAMSLLLGIYFSGLLRSRLAGMLTGISTAGCYSLLYLLVLSEEYALLLGALTLFAALASVMVATRKLDWYRVTESRQREP
jgi:inner membrane protein